MYQGRTLGSLDGTPSDVVLETRGVSATGTAGMSPQTPVGETGSAPGRSREGTQGIVSTSRQSCLELQ